MSLPPVPTNAWPERLSRNESGDEAVMVERKLLDSIVAEQFDPANHTVRVFALSCFGIKRV
jgi:hypothetical protein